MKYFTLLPAIFLLIMCHSTEPDPGFDMDLFTKSWSHSWEEQQDSVQIYRPTQGREFPALRYRQEYIFNKDSTASWSALAANDGHYYLNGRWRYDGENQILIMDMMGKEVNRLTILELTKDILHFTFNKTLIIE